MSANNHSRWTDDEDRRLLEWKAAGKSSVYIGTKLRRTAVAVQQRLYVLRDRARSQGDKDAFDLWWEWATKPVESDRSRPRSTTP